jgi:hypothetical protein
MSADSQTRTYCLHGMKLDVSCSPAMAACLDARFRLLRSEEPCSTTIFFDFQSVADLNEHLINRPQGASRPFYEMPQGEAAYFDRTDEVYVSFGHAVRALCNPASGRVVVSTLETDPGNLFMASHLVLTILLVELFRRRGWYSLHAAGFSDNGRAVLIPGTSGAGKSTLTLALLRAKFDYLSDDMVFFRSSSHGLFVRGLLEDVDVTDQTVRFFPELEFLLRAPKVDGFPKRQVRAEEIFGTKVVSEAQPKVIILPHISGKQNSVITPISGDEALLEIVPNVLLTEQQTCQVHLAVFAELVKQAACYRLETGTDFNRIPLLFRALLACDQEEICA